VLVNAFDQAVVTIIADKKNKQADQMKIKLTNVDKKRILETFVENDEALG